MRAPVRSVKSIYQHRSCKLICIFKHTSCKFMCLLKYLSEFSSKDQTSFCTFSSMAHASFFTCFSSHHTSLCKLMWMLMYKSGKPMHMWTTGRSPHRNMSVKLCFINAQSMLSSFQLIFIQVSYIICNLKVLLLNLFEILHVNMNE